MYNFDKLDEMNEIERLKYMNYLLKSQLSSEVDDLANISNATGIIKTCIDNLNWVGFYILRDDELVLGPFQGKPACNRIKIGNGVCGSSVKEKKTILVEDVLVFPGHIFCDGDSKSELVIPIIVEDNVIGVLDLDSPILSRFTELEKEYFEEFINILVEKINWENI